MYRNAGGHHAGRGDQCDALQRVAATIAKIVDTLNYFGLEHSEEIVYTCGEEDVTLPKCAIILEKMGRYSHYLVAFDGKFYDSNLGVLDRYDMTKMKGYLEILV